jgi:hypothetical protein
VIVCGNPIEISLDDMAARHGIGLQRLLNTGDGRLLDYKVLSCGLACDQHGCHSNHAYSEFLHHRSP